MHPECIGHLRDLTDQPRAVTVNGLPCFLVKASDQQPRLLSALCPHQGGLVECLGDQFECRVHGWSFAHCGAALEADRGMKAYPLRVESDGRIFVDLEDEES